MSPPESDGRCVLCDRLTDAAPVMPTQRDLVYRENDVMPLQRVRLTRTLTLCERCVRDQRALAACPRCRGYARYPPYAHAPYGAWCDECGSRLYLVSGETPVT